MNTSKPAEPLPGIAAKWSGDCPRCPYAIHPGDRIFFNRGRAVHVGCASGADE